MKPIKTAKTPAKRYTKGMGQAVADRTINRKTTHKLKKTEILPALLSINENNSINEEVDIYCRSKGFVISHYDVISQDLNTVNINLHIIAKQEMEHWKDVAYRVSKGNTSLHPADADIEFDKMNHHLRQASLLMSGRHLQHGDETQSSRNMEVFTNCSTAAMSFLEFYLLLNGSGVGRAFDDELMVTDYRNLPIVVTIIDGSHGDVLSGEIREKLDKRSAEHMYKNKTIVYYEVGDSRELWAKAIEKMEVMAFQKIHKNSVLLLDFSKVRCKGSPIRGMQNRPASGPGPLISAIEKMAKLRDASMEPWRATMFADHYLAECVLVGGARRAARMATKTWRDSTIFSFINLKRGGFLWSSNNSVTVDAEFWKYVKNETINTEIAIHARKVFDAIASASYHDGTGEPGIINQDKLTDNKSGFENYLEGNFAESERYKLETETIELAKSIAIVANEMEYRQITNPCQPAFAPIRLNGLNKTFADIVIGDKVDTGYEKKATIINKWSTGVKQVYQYIIGDCSFIGTENHRVVIESPNGLLLKMEIEEAMIHGFKIKCGNGNYYEINSKIFLGEHEVFEITVDNDEHVYITGGVVASNCGEITLNLLGGYCVIADVVPYHAQNDDDACDSFATATKSLMRVNLMDSMYKKEVSRTNRIGVGITGFHEWAWNRFGYGWKDIVSESVSIDMWLTLSKFKRTVVKTATEYSAVLGTTIPHTDTTIKPAGTTSKLFGLTEGAHLPSMREFLRWVQFRNDDPIVEDYKKKGYPTKVLTSYSGTTIVGFPTQPEICKLKMGDKLVTAAEATPEEQYEYLRLLEKYWIRGVEEDGITPLAESGNQVSYTLKYNPEKVSFEDFKRTLLDGQSSVRCCSVMPQTDASAYEYQPEEMVTSSRYQQIINEIEKSNQTEVKEDVAFEHIDCGSGACPIDFNSK